MVRRKLTPRALRQARQTELPRFLRAGRSLAAVDVVEVGSLRRQTDVVGGESLGPAGQQRLATLGTFALGPSGDVLALTAMHLFYGLPQPSPGQRLVTAPSEVDMADAPVLGAFVDGTMIGVDAASISVDPTNAAEWYIGQQPIRGWRSLCLPGDESLTVHIVGARSGYQRGVIENACTEFPPWRLRSAITAHISTTDGDSGAALLDDNGYVLGLLVGQPDKHDTLRVFCAIGAVLDELGCDIPSRH